MDKYRGSEEEKGCVWGVWVGVTERYRDQRGRRWRHEERSQREMRERLRPRWRQPDRRRDTEWNLERESEPG